MTKVSTVADLQDLNRKIVELGEKFNKPVCATCDVHFLNPEDEVYRRIIMSNKGFGDADLQPRCTFGPQRRCWMSFSTWELRKQKRWL